MFLCSTEPCTLKGFSSPSSLLGRGQTEALGAYPGPRPGLLAQLKALPIMWPLSSKQLTTQAKVQRSPPALRGCVSSGGHLRFSHPPTWLASFRQLLLLLLSWVGMVLIEVSAMDCWARKVGEGWIRGGVCPKAEPRPRCWLRICW